MNLQFYVCRIKCRAINLQEIMFEPSYIKSYKSGELKKRIKQCYDILRECVLCPRNCKVNRLSEEIGFCKTGLLPKVSSYSPHFGEEAPLVGKYGSGTIFFTNCNLGCIFCQNWDISHNGEGKEISIETLAKMMLHLQDLGCHNINFVTPSHVVPFILSALEIAIEAGLIVPLVYNSGGYDSIYTLKLLNGIFDIYMPDFKFWESKYSEKYAKCSNYPKIAKLAIKEMHNQVGDLIIDKNGIAQKGLLIRHLVMPEKISGTKEIMNFIANEISKNSYVNIMDQYRPCFKANSFLEINRTITNREYYDAINYALQAGLTRLDK